MRYTKTVYPLAGVEGAFGFSVEDNGNTIIINDYHPQESGNTPMTEETASNLAQEVVDRMNAEEEAAQQAQG